MTNYPTPALDRDRPTILREFLGGSEKLSVDSWASLAIQDHDVAYEIGMSMLRDQAHEHDDTSTQERYEIIDVEHFTMQLAALSADAETYAAEHVAAARGETRAAAHREVTLRAIFRVLHNLDPSVDAERDDSQEGVIRVDFSDGSALVVRVVVETPA